MKKIITLQEAYDLISKATAVTVDGFIAGRCFYNIIGDDYNEWLYLSWEDLNGIDYGTSFIEESQEIVLDNSTIYMLDSEDEMTEILLLGPMIIE